MPDIRSQIPYALNTAIYHDWLQTYIKIEFDKLRISLLTRICSGFAILTIVSYGTNSQFTCDAE